MSALPCKLASLGISIGACGVARDNATLLQKILSLDTDPASVGLSPNLPVLSACPAAIYG
jgi:hypothetical protein